jgi:hypothetical protein
LGYHRISEGGTLYSLVLDTWYLKKEATAKLLAAGMREDNQVVACHSTDPPVPPVCCCIVSTC